MRWGACHSHTRPWEIKSTWRIFRFKTTGACHSHTSVWNEVKENLIKISTVRVSASFMYGCARTHTLTWQLASIHWPRASIRPHFVFFSFNTIGHGGAKKPCTPSTSRPNSNWSTRKTTYIQRAQWRWERWCRQVVLYL